MFVKSLLCKQKKSKHNLLTFKHLLIQRQTYSHLQLGAGETGTPATMTTTGAMKIKVLSKKIKVGNIVMPESHNNILSQRVH